MLQHHFIFRTSEGFRSDGGLGPRSHWGCGWSERGASWNSDPSVATRAADLARGASDYTTEEGSSQTWGRQAPETQLPPEGTRAVPQIFPDVRTKDVGSDRRNDAWSPGNVLVDTVARMQQDLADIRAENRLLRTLGVPPVVRTLGRRRSRRLKFHGLVG